MTSALSRFEFAADPAYARRIMQRYAAMFGSGPVADLGAGRGYFLEALRAKGLAGIGVDLSDEAVQRTRELGFECVQADALHYLRDARDLGGVFASHLIEHLEPPAAEELLSLAAAALAPGGRLIVVTPNLADQRVLTEVFWLDPTHVRPYPSRLIAAMLQAHGLVVDELGRGRTPLGRRALPRTIVGRIRFGGDYGVSEVFVRAHRP